MYKVFASDGLAEEAQNKFQESELFELRVNELGPWNSSEIDFLIVRSATQVNKECLESMPQLKGVVRAGVGVDNIDLDFAAQKGVCVWNAPTGNFQATAEHALGLSFALFRKTTQADAAAKQLKWAKKELGSQGRQFLNSFIGVMGAGNIGRRFAQMAHALGAKVLLCDPYLKEGDLSFAQQVDFDTLLKKSDLISIHTPLVNETRALFNKAAFEKMKKTSYLVNAARGGIVKELDLLSALENNEISGAALDVFEKEPYDVTSESLKKLLSHDRVVATPHIAASTQESQVAVGLEAFEKIHNAVSSAQDSLVFPLTLNGLDTLKI